MCTNKNQPHHFLSTISVLIEHCTNTAVKVISQFLMLLLAVSETLHFFFFFKPDENKSTVFSPYIPVSFQQIHDVVTFYNVCAMSGTEILSHE